MSISYTRHNKGSEKYHEVKLCVCVWGGGGARGAYLAHGLFVFYLANITLPYRLLIYLFIYAYNLVCWYRIYLSLPGTSRIPGPLNLLPFSDQYEY